MRRVQFLLAALVVALILAACGGAESEPEAVSGGGAEALTVEGTDSLQFSPASADVKSGTQVRLTFENRSALEHSWVLVPGDADAATVTEADAVAGATTGIVQAGQSKSITFTAPAPGTYQYVCTVPGHAAGGMVGTLNVQ